MHYFAFVYRSRFGTITIKIGSCLNIFTCCREAVSRLFCHCSPFVWKPSPLSVPLNLATERNTIQRSLLGCLGYSFRFIRLTKTFDRKHLLLIFHDLPLQQPLNPSDSAKKSNVCIGGTQPTFGGKIFPPFSVRKRGACHATNMTFVLNPSRNFFPGGRHKEG